MPATRWYGPRARNDGSTSTDIDTGCSWQQPATVRKYSSCSINSGQNWWRNLHTDCIFKTQYVTYNSYTLKCCMTDWLFDKNESQTQINQWDKHKPLKEHKLILRPKHHVIEKWPNSPKKSTTKSLHTFGCLSCVLLTKKWCHQIVRSCYQTLFVISGQLMNVCANGHKNVCQNY